MKNVGTRLEDIRKRLSLSWGELATHIGISRAMLDFLRNGSREPSPKTSRRIMEAERASGIVPLEDYDLPKAKLENIEYGFPGDAMDNKEALRKISQDIAHTKEQLTLIKIALREILREELEKLKTDLINELKREK